MVLSRLAVLAYEADEYLRNRAELNFRANKVWLRTLPRRFASGITCMVAAAPPFSNAETSLVNDFQPPSRRYGGVISCRQSFHVVSTSDPCPLVLSENPPHYGRLLRG
jgi:hypothetical protein